MTMTSRRMPSVGIADRIARYILILWMLWVVQCTRNSSLPCRLNLHLSLVGRLSCAYDLNHLETLLECKPSPARLADQRSAVVCMDRAPTDDGNNICIRCSEAARGHLRDGRKGERAAVRTSIIVAAVYPNTATAAAAAASFRQCDRNE